MESFGLSTKVYSHKLTIRWCGGLHWCWFFLSISFCNCADCCLIPCFSSPEIFLLDIFNKKPIFAHSIFIFSSQIRCWGLKKAKYHLKCIRRCICNYSFEIQVWFTKLERMFFPFIQTTSLIICHRISALKKNTIEIKASSYDGRFLRLSRTK